MHAGKVAGPNTQLQWDGKLVPTKGQCSAAGKATVGLASH